MQLVVLSRTIDGAEPHDWVVLRASNTHKHRVGVQVAHRIEIVTIDEDFFSED